MPDSKVAGRATVLIFPDLNTGNNTYKAVQRSAGAVAIGPGAAGAEQAGQRPVPGRAGRGHRQHRGDHGDPGAGQVMRVHRTVLVLNSRLVVAEIRCRGTGFGRPWWPTGSSSGSATGPIADHAAALRVAFDTARRFDGQTAGRLWDWSRSGHRVVHGGPDLYRPTLVDDALIVKLEELSPLAPLHNPPAVLGIEVARKALPDLPHVAVFDTAFFHDLPPAAATYAIDREIAAAVAHPPLRLSRHVAPVRQRAGGGVPGRAAGVAEPDRAAPGQRRVGVGDRRRPTRRHVDGPDADGGPGDGHPLRRHRPRRHLVSVRAPPG